MKNKLMPLFGKLALRKRSMMESFRQLKNVFQVEHARHHGIVNGFINIISTLHHDIKPWSFSSQAS